jgi:hypothetical protein
LLHRQVDHRVERRLGQHQFAAHIACFQFRVAPHQTQHQRIVIEAAAVRIHGEFERIGVVDELLGWQRLAERALEGREWNAVARDAGCRGVTFHVEVDFRQFFRLAIDFAAGYHGHLVVESHAQYIGAGLPLVSDMHGEIPGADRNLDIGAEPHGGVAERSLHATLFIRNQRFWHHRLDGFRIGQIFDQDALRFGLQRTGRRALLCLLHQLFQGFDETGFGHGVLRDMLWVSELHFC